MMAPKQLQCIFSYTVLANPEVTYPQFVQSQWAVDQSHLAIIKDNIHGYLSQKSAQINTPLEHE